LFDVFLSIAAFDWIFFESSSTSMKDSIAGKAFETAKGVNHHHLFTQSKVGPELPVVGRIKISSIQGPATKCSSFKTLSLVR
jgi:hypothetical protein